MFGQPDVAQHGAALLRQPRHIEDHAGLALDMRGHAEQRADGEHAGAADAADSDVIGPLQRGPRQRFGQIADIAQVGRRAPAQLAAVDGDKGRAKAFQAGIVLVAGRLVDGALASQFGLQRLHRDAVRLHRTIAAAFAHGRIDDHAASRILHRSSFAAAAFFGSTGLDEYDCGRALYLAQRSHDRVELVAMRGLGARRNLGSRIDGGIFRNEIDFADAFRVQLEGHLLRRQVAVDVLAAGHRGRVVVENLVGDVGAGGNGLADRETAGMEVGAVAEIGEHMLFLGKGRHAHPRHALASHVGVGLGIAVHPERHEMAADAGEGAAAFGHLGRSVVRTAGAEIRRAGDRRHRLHLGGQAAVEPVGLGAQHRRDLGIEIEAKQPLGERARKGGYAELCRKCQEALVVLVHLADDARTHVIAPVEQLLLDLVLDDLAPLLDDEDLLEPDRELPNTFRLQRPRHADLVKPQTDLGGDFRRDAKFAQRLADVLIALARSHDAEPRVRRIHGDAVDLVGPRKGDRGESLVVLQAQVLLVAVVGPAQVEPAGRHLKVGRDDERLHLIGEIDLGGGLYRLGDHLHADPASGIARHRDAEQAHLDHFVDAGRIEVGHQRGDKGMVGLMRHGGGFCAMVVAGETEHTAVFRRARGIGVTKHVAAAIDAGALAVPDADDAVVLGAGGKIELLGTPDRGGREVFIHAGLELDVVLLEVLAGGK